MKSKKNIKLGGFCGVNTGSISNSFSVSDMSKAREIASFCYKNTGEINTCFAKSSIRKQDVNNFCFDNRGEITCSFSNMKSKENMSGCIKKIR